MSDPIYLPFTLMLIVSDPIYHLSCLTPFTSFLPLIYHLPLPRHLHRPTVGNFYTPAPLAGRHARLQDPGGRFTAFVSATYKCFAGLFEKVARILLTLYVQKSPIPGGTFGTRTGHL